MALLSTFVSANTYAASSVVDARGHAMGNTGVASADYLMAGFYNPALVSNFRDSDNIGILLPGVSVKAQDSDDSYSTIEDLHDFMDDRDHRRLSPNEQQQLENYLNDLDGNAPLKVNANLGVAIAIPSNVVAVNLFGRGYSEVIAAVNVSDASDAEQRYDESTVDMLAFGYVEFGLALAKQVKIADQQFSFGITPKFQRMSTFVQTSNLDDFEVDEYDEHEITQDAFNLDLGMAWYKQNFRIALAAKDLIAQEIDVYGSSDTYQLDPQVTVALAYSSDYFTAAIDADLTEQTRFQSIADDTQFVRVGIEGNAFGWIQLRAGYQIDLQDTLGDTVTAGIGISPFDTISLDLSASYTDENELGAAMNIAFTF